MEHLALEIFDADNVKSKFALLEEDASVKIIDTSDIFDKGNIWSHPFTLNVFANAHIFGSMGDIHGARLHDVIGNRKARLWVEGVPFYLGDLVLDNEADIDKEGNFDVKLECGRKIFEKKIEGGKANQVPLMDKVRFGVALWRKRWSHMRLSLEAAPVVNGETSVYYSVVQHNIDPNEYGDTDENVTVFNNEGELESQVLQEYPRIVFPEGNFLSVSGEDVIVNDLNIDYPYTEDDKGTPTHPFCNVALCYQKQGYEKLKDNGDEEEDFESEPSAQRGYEYMPANRVNSAPNFFVIYWLRCLMKYLEIYVEENQMMDVEDLRRLFFVNTKCEYEEPEHIRMDNIYDGEIPRYKIRRGNAGARIAEVIKERYKIPQKEECHILCTNYVVDDNPSDIPIEGVRVRVKKIEDSSFSNEKYIDENSWAHDAYATSKCFPDEDISSVINAIETGFGVRFVFDKDYQRVRIVLLRNIFKNSDVQQVKCDVLEIKKTENNIRGFRMTYGDKKDTHFYYKGFADLLPHMNELWVDNDDKHDYSQWILDKDYGAVINKVTAFNNICYVTPETGNAYGVKIDKDAKKYKDLYPSLFEYAGFMDAEDGDCTGEEDSIETLNVGFAPAIMNDLNAKEEQDGSREQKFALIVEENMRPRRLDLDDGNDYNSPTSYYDVNKMEELFGKDSPSPKVDKEGNVAPGMFSICSDAHVQKKGLSLHSRLFSLDWYFPGIKPKDEKRIDVSMDIDGGVNEGYRLYLQDNFEPNDDGISPIEKHEWGLTLGIMRGSGSDAMVKYIGDPDDMEGNKSWLIKPGSNATSHADTCDCYGNPWKYDFGNSRTITISSPVDAKNAVTELFPKSNIEPSHRTSTDWVFSTYLYYSVNANTGKGYRVLLAQRTKNNSIDISPTEMKDYVLQYLEGKSVAEMYAEDARRKKILIEVDSSAERQKTFVALQELAFNGGNPVTLDGIAPKKVCVTDGRFSLKLRAEKLNPFFDPKQPESKTSNPRYLEITNPNLRQRGLVDQFYKEYSYWVRNARIATITLSITFSQLLSINKMVKVSVGDVTGFIRKMEYTVSNKTGLGLVEMEIMYI